MRSPRLLASEAMGVHHNHKIDRYILGNNADNPSVCYKYPTKGWWQLSLIIYIKLPVVGSDVVSVVISSFNSDRVEEGENMQLP